MADNANELAAQFGYAAGFFQSIPELAGLLQRAINEKWTPQRFQGEFLTTGWYRQHSASEREWDTLQKTDPATAQRRVIEQVTKLRNMAAQMGIPVSEDRLDQMGRESIAGGYSDDLLKQLLTAEYHYQAGGTSGGAAGTETSIKKMAGDYGVTLSDQDVGSLVSGVLMGRLGQDNVTDFVRDQARSKYPGMKDWIDQGLTVRQVASPYTSSYSKLLEVAPDTVDLQDPMIQKALQGSKNQQGQWQQQTLYDFENTLRNTSQWLKTDNAKQATQNTTNQVLRDWGLVS